MNDRSTARARRASALTSVLAVFAGLPAPWAQAQPAADAKSADSRVAGGSAFTLTSPDITNGGTIASAQVFNSFGCTGQNISPALAWSHIPAGTKSFALLVHDPDAPTGSGWWHWVVYNIPATATGLPAGAGDPAKNLMPAGAVQGRTDYGSPGYGGPCPPPGKPHHYYFRLYALKVPKLDLPADATPALVGFNVNANSLGKAELLGLYGR
ncbi:MAG TPA: YbhB/YbcL family Raf kinase inhibitor-like protein [Steroidobacteraceae bacterium]|nr:YbhB/YbcL family Raf kinase inhibitor-like protein [Steroidobacteraceae bacterium]